MVVHIYAAAFAHILASAAVGTFVCVNVNLEYGEAGNESEGGAYRAYRVAYYAPPASREAGDNGGCDDSNGGTRPACHRFDSHIVLPCQVCRRFGGGACQKAVDRRQDVVAHPHVRCVGVDDGRHCKDSMRQPSTMSTVMYLTLFAGAV